MVFWIPNFQISRFQISRNLAWAGLGLGPCAGLGRVLKRPGPITKYTILQEENQRRQDEDGEDSHIRKLQEEADSAQSKAVATAIAVEAAKRDVVGLLQKYDICAWTPAKLRPVS